MSVINRAHCKKLALDIAEIRSKKFNRVSKKFLDRLEFKLEEIIKDSVRNHPSVGKTLTEVR